MTKSEIASAFSNGNFEICFKYLIESTTWNTPGEQVLNNKVEIEDFCKKIRSYFDSITTNFQQSKLIENENCIAITGTAEFIRDGKRIDFVSSCNVYEFNNENKILNITSYCIGIKRKSIACVNKGLA